MFKHRNSHELWQYDKEPAIIHNRRRWYILIIGSISYLASHHYGYAIPITVAFDLVMNLANVFIAGARVASKPEYVAADVVIRIACIVAGITINAFASYVFDLSFLFGVSYFLMAIFMLIYLFVRMLDWAMPNKIHVDYFFVLGSLGALWFFDNNAVFGEPYTYLTEAIYIISVYFLVLISDLRHMQWWSFFIFAVFWAVAILVGWLINTFQMHHHYKYPLSHYFR